MNSHFNETSDESIIKANKFYTIILTGNHLNINVSE